MHTTCKRCRSSMFNTAADSKSCDFCSAVVGDFVESQPACYWEGKPWPSFKEALQWQDRQNAVRGLSKREATEYGAPF